MRYKFLRDPRLWIALALSLAVSGLSLAAGWRPVVEGSTGRVVQFYTQSRLGDIDEVVRAYRQKNHVLPHSLSQLRGEEYRKANIDEKGVVFDWWHHPIIYSVHGNTYRVVSYGRDGKPGGYGLDSDLSNSNSRPREADPTFAEFLSLPQAVSTIIICLIAGAIAGYIGWSECSSSKLEHVGYITLAAKLILTLSVTLLVTFVIVALDGISHGH